MNASELKKESKYLQELITKKVHAFKQQRGEKVISPFVMGLDISKNKTGIGIINEDTLKTVYYTYYEPSSSDIKEIALEYSFLIDLMFEKYKISKVVIEDTFISDKTSSIKDLSIVHGSMLINILMRNVSIFKIPTMSCKAFFSCAKPMKDDLGKKIKEAKEVLFDEIKKRFELSDDLDFKNFNDITDALALANCIKETKMKKKQYKKNGIKLFEYVPILKEY